MNEEFLNSDLITRLRGYAEADFLADTCTEAADEIERLRTALALAVGELSTYGNMQHLSPEQLMQQFLDEADAR